jgi:hypothetical protein
MIRRKECIYAPWDSEAAVRDRLGLRPRKTAEAARKSCAKTQNMDVDDVETSICAATAFISSKNRRCLASGPLAG